MRNLFYSKFLPLCILLCSANLLTNAQAPCIKWQKTKGGTGDEYFYNSIIKLSGGNFLVCGATSSAFPGVHGDYDAFIAKFNPNGKTLWMKFYGGTGFDYFANVIQNNDGSFIAVGTTNSNDGDVSGNHGGDNDGWVVKLSANGNLQWQKCYGGSGDDQLTSVTKGSGNTFVAAGFSTSNDGDVNGNHGDYDGWVVKSNKNGNILWSKCIGGSAYDDIFGLNKVAGNHYVAAGGTASNDGDISGNHGGDYDSYAVRLDDNGNLSWSKCYGGSDFEFPNASTVLSDGNICFTGVTLSNDGDVSGYHGINDPWTVKINQSTGALIWQICSGNATDGEVTFGLTSTSDGGVLMAGLGALGHNNGVPANVEAFKIDANGNEEWSINIGGSSDDGATGVVETDEGDFILSCCTNSTDGDVTGNHGGFDAWIVKLSADGCNHNHRDANNNFVSNNFSLNSFPNPFSNSTTISFSILQSQNVSLKIFDVNGRLIKTLANNTFEEGVHQIEFNAEKLNAGIYILSIQTSEFTKTEKLIVTK